MSSKKASKKDKLKDSTELEAPVLEVKKSKKSKRKQEEQIEPLNNSVLQQKKKKRKSANNNNEANMNSKQDIDLDGLMDIKNVLNRSDPFDEEKHSNEEDAKEDKKKQEITWPNEDLLILVANMEKLIPQYDGMAFTTRSEKLEWEKAVFKNYTVEECKKTWALLSKKIRRYRLLKEVLSDARELITNPQIHRKNKKSIHPDMPKRPLSSYLLFYLKQKDHIIAENPGLELTEVSKKIGSIYKTLSPEKKAIYEGMAAEAKDVYEEKLKQFYENHPEYKVVKPTAAQKERVKERVPKKPLTPYAFFYQAELKKHENTNLDKQQFKDVCKEKWKQLSDKKKLVWIQFAENKQKEYEKDLINYQASHPNYVVNHAPKLTLTKEEKSVKERVAGKPIKPPNSAYSLFVRNVLQGTEVKGIPTKQRLNFCSNQWKDISDHEKQQYKNLHNSLMAQYKEDYAHYLSSLPEDQRKLEMEQSGPKRRKSEDPGEMSPAKKKKKTTKAAKGGTDKKLKEPEQPPVSAFKFFAKTYSGKESVQQAWKKLPQGDKEKWERELIKTKHEYIENFERFLKSLTKEELAAFSQARNLAKQQAQEVSEDEDEPDDSGEDSEDDSSNSESENESSDED